MQAGRWVAGLNLDMVGRRPERRPAARGSWSACPGRRGFADHLLSLAARCPSSTGSATCETGDSAGGSDHYILSDPTVGIQTPMLNQWPDKFYHTSDDTLDKVSVDSLGRSGALPSPMPPGSPRPASRRRPGWAG